MTQATAIPPTQPGVSDTEHAFRHALLQADVAVPDGLHDGQGRAAGRRYAVYRNNVVVSLREALETGFSAVASLIGAERFAIVARAYIAQNPPSSARMMLYGGGFAGFLAGFEPLKSFGYLSDVARLEYAIRRSYHAQDAAPLDVARLAALDEAALASARFALAPSVRIIQSHWPIHAIHQFALDGGEKPPATAQDVLVARPEFDPVARVLPAGGAAFFAALAKQDSFARAAEAAGPDFDLNQTLSLALETGALTDIFLEGTSS